MTAPEPLRLGVEEMPPPAGPVVIPLRRPYRLCTLDEVEALQPPPWLVEGILPAQSLGLLYGPSGGGKSFVALDLALSIATGFPWHGHNVEGGSVVYCAGEGITGLGRRIGAWRAGRKPLDPLAEGQAARTRIFVAEVPRLLESGAVPAFVEAVRAVDAKAVLVVVDTFARAIVGGEENSARDVGMAIAAADRIKAVLGAAVLFVHHAGKTRERGARGSSALLAAVDSAFSLDGPTDRLELRCEKQKDAEPAKSIPLALEVVDLGKDAKGAPVTSCRVRARTAADLTREKAAEAGRLVTALGRPEFAAGATRAQLQEELSMGRTATHTVLRAALDAGRIVATGSNRSTRYRLPEASP